MTLVLLPRDPQAPTPDAEALTEALQKIAFIGRAIDVVGGRRYRPGDHFSRFLAFVGPQRVTLLGTFEEDSEADPSRCRVKIDEERGEIDFLAGSQVESPKCRGCASTIADWTSQLERWRSGGDSFSCAGCGARNEPWQFDWNRTAGFGRFSIGIEGIGLGDATPTAALLATLWSTNNADWDYFFAID